MFKLLKLTALFFLLFLIFGQTALAQSQSSFINIVMPVRGEENWSSKNTGPERSFRTYLDSLNQKGLSGSFLLRYDALGLPQITTTLASSSQHETGLFLEVTPTLASAAGVKYHTSGSWHQARSVLLTGYEVEDRKKLIDTNFAKFKSVFGFYPKSVGAWWIDGDSLTYMHQKYQITTNLSVSDQYSTDDYQVWGQFWSSPFYPSKFNASQPAQKEENKTGTTTIQWATRDPYNGYGERVEDSTFSVQANDYLTHPNLNTTYFNNLIDIYLKPKDPYFNQVTVGIENDFTDPKIQSEFNNQLDEIARRQNGGEARVVKMSEFVSWFTTNFPKLSPPRVLFATNPFNKNDHVLWYSNNDYRVGLFQNGSGLTIRDLRTYSDSMEEPCLKKSCTDLDLARTTAKPIDDVTYRQHLTIQEGSVSNLVVNQLSDRVSVDFTNVLGVARNLTFAKNDIFIDSKPSTIPGLIIETTKDVPSNKINLANKNALPLLDLGYSIKSILIFLAAAVVFFYLPGRFILKAVVGDMHFFEELTLSTTLGIVAFIVVSFISLILGNFLPFILIFILAAFSLKRKFTYPKFSINKPIFLVFVFSVVISTVPVIKSGLLFPYGLGFWGPNGHDGIWHLALIESLKYGFPPENYLFSGSSLANYHFFFDLVLANLTRIPFLDSISLYFRLWPILLSVLLGATLWILARRYKLNDLSTSILIFLFFVGGSWGWLVSVFRNHDLGGESMFWANQSISLHLNPPFALSILLVILLMILLSFMEEAGSKKLAVISSVIVGVLWGVKAYAGVLSWVSLGIICIFYFLKKKDKRYLIILILSSLLSAIFFLSLTTLGNALFVLSPLYLVHSMVDSQDRLNWTRLASARLAYRTGGNLVKLYLAEVLALGIFLLGNFGARVLGLYHSLKYLRREHLSLNFLTLLIILGTLPPLLFIQKGTPWNTIQFLYYSMFGLTIYSAFLLNTFKPKLSLRIFLLIALIILSSITTISTLTQYVPGEAAAYISSKELEALNFLKTRPQGVVLSKPFDADQSDNFNPPIPQYAYVSSAYISAMSAKPSFIADQVNLDILSVPYKERLVGASEYFNLPSSDWSKNFLKQNKINYVYTLKRNNFPHNTGLVRIFENQEVEIFEVI